MKKNPVNQGKNWSEKEVSEMKKLVKGNTPVGLIAHKLMRTEAGIQSKAQSLHLSLKPINRSPYNRHKK